MRWGMLLGLCLVAVAAGAQPPPRVHVPEVTLSSGLQVLGFQDQSTDLVGVFLAVKAGAATEQPDLHGARNLLQEAFRYRLEQELRSDRRYLDLTAALLVGQGLSLHTGWDYAALTTLCPRPELRRLLRVLGQTAFLEDLTPEALASGQRRSLEEWEAHRNSPFERTYYLFRRSLLGAQTVARPVFASPEEMIRLTRPALEAYRARYYVPSNTLLVLVGPDDPENLVRDAVRALEDLPRRPAPPDWLPALPLPEPNLQVGANPALRHGRGEVASLMVGFPFPTVTDPSFAAGLVLYGLLTGPRGLLQEDRNFMRSLAVQLYGRPLLAGDPLQILGPTPSAVPYLAVHVQTAPTAVFELQQALLAALENVSARAADPAVLERGRRRALNALALSGHDQQMRARRLGEWALFAGSWRQLQNLPAQIQAVTSEHVQQVAAACFARQYVALQLPE